jgi:hypothetical protein
VQHQSLVLHGLRTRPPGVDPRAADGDGRVLHQRGHGKRTKARSAPGQEAQDTRSGQGALARRHTDGPLWAALLKTTVMCKAWRRCTTLLGILLELFFSTVLAKPQFFLITGSSIPIHSYITGSSIPIHRASNPFRIQNHVTRSYCSLARPPNTHSLVLVTAISRIRPDGPRNLLEVQGLHPTQPSALVLYCSYFTLTLLHKDRSLVPSRSSQPNRRATRCFGEIWVSDCMLQRLHARLLPILHTLTHTLSLDSCCRPTAGKPN